MVGSNELLEFRILKFWALQKSRSLNGLNFRLKSFQQKKARTTYLLYDVDHVLGLLLLQERVNIVQELSKMLFASSVRYDHGDLLDGLAVRWLEVSARLEFGALGFELIERDVVDQQLYSTNQVGRYHRTRRETRLRAIYIADALVGQIEILQRQVIAEVDLPARLRLDIVEQPKLVLEKEVVLSRGEVRRQILVVVVCIDVDVGRVLHEQQDEDENGDQLEQIGLDEVQNRMVHVVGLVWRVQVCIIHFRRLPGGCFFIIELIKKIA